MTSDKNPPPPPVLFGVLLLALATLMLEITWLRVLSVTLWYHFAFIVLSTALFGFGLAAVVMSLLFPFGAPPLQFAKTSALATPLGFAACFVISNQIPFEPFSLGKDSLQALYMPLFFLVTTLPFFLSGLSIAAQAARYAEQFHRIYLYDLVGAGFGTAAVIFLLPLLGGEGCMFFAAAVAALGAALICTGGMNLSRSMAGVAFAGLVSLSAYPPSCTDIRISSDKVTGDGVPLGQLFDDPKFHLYKAWNTGARVDVLEWRVGRGQRERAIFIDGGVAVTRLPHVTLPLDRLLPGTDEESFFYRLASSPKVLVVGSGGGREVLLALRSGASKVFAVELNPDINDIASRKMADYTGHIFDDDRVALYTDEARSFLNRSDDAYDVIHCPHTISNAAMASGALSLAENYLLTQEAFQSYIGHLSERGILIITRPEAHLPRLIATLAAAAPKNLSERLFAWRAVGPAPSFYAGIAYLKENLSAADTARFREILAKRNLEPLVLPGAPSKEPYFSLIRGKEPPPTAALEKTILSPATDDKPFFNRRIPFSEIRPTDIAAVFSSGTEGRDALEDRPVTESALLVLLIEIALLALFAIILPVGIARKRGHKIRLLTRWNGVFFFLGLAFIFGEIGLMQRLTLYLGRPTIVYGTVLCSLLVASGLGAMVSAYRMQNLRHRTFALLAMGALATAAILAAPTISYTLALPLPVRILLTVCLVGGAGFFMGMPFPAVIRSLSTFSIRDVALGLGINGFAGTVGTVAAVLIAMTLGQTAVLVTAGLCYWVAAFFASGLSRTKD